MDILNMLITYAAQIINFLFPNPFTSGITNETVGATDA